MKTNIATDAHFELEGLLVSARQLSYRAGLYGWAKTGDANSPLDDLVRQVTRVIDLVAEERVGGFGPSPATLDGAIGEFRRMETSLRIDLRQIQENRASVATGFARYALAATGASLVLLGGAVGTLAGRSLGWLGWVTLCGVAALAGMHAHRLPAFVSWVCTAPQVWIGNFRLRRIAGKIRRLEMQRIKEVETRSRAEQWAEVRREQTLAEIRLHQQLGYTAALDPIHQ